jgi:hypothetical protein
MNSSHVISPMTSTLHSLYMAPRSATSEESIDLPHAVTQPIQQSTNVNINHHATFYDRVQDKNQSQSSHQQAAQEHKEDVDRQTVKKLSTLDREVRQHERAHAALGGQYAGAPRYEYEKGPNGISYAVEGKVSIDTTPVAGDPQMSIEKAQIIRRAALAPAEPSAQDRKVAAEAVQMEVDARIELLEIEQRQRLEEQRLQDEAQMKEKSELANSQESIALRPHMEVTTVDDEPVETMNHTQEQFFNEINNDLAAQLVALGAAQQAPRSLGSIINRLV